MIRICGDTLKDEADAFDTLRAVRLWHWQEAARLRRKADRQAEKGTVDESVIDTNNRKAEAHAAFVARLDAFFPDGDTAERDSEKVRP